MHPCSKWIVLALIVLLSFMPAVAGLKDIHTDKLPQDKAVLQAYGNLLAIEEMVHDWSPEWHYSTPKEQVLAKVEASLAALKTALHAAPDNVELLLLTGLVAHYAYNIDVPDTYDLAMGSFEKAHTLAPEDYRAEWFTGTHQCHTTHVEAGMEKLLEVERLLGTRVPPFSFWDDYIFCASVTTMPAHVLRAADRVKRSGPPPSAMRDFLVGGAQKRFTTPDPASTYTAKEVWGSKQLSSGALVLINSLCGFSVVSQGDWKLGLPDEKKGTCVIQLQTGPFTGRDGDVYPYVIVVVRQPKPGETLEQFASTHATGAFARPGTFTCPTEGCLTFESVKPAGYKAEGDAHFIVTVFKRAAPEFPGLLFEEPSGPQPPKDGQAHVFHPGERLRRLEGTLYYLVGIDTASSVLSSATSEYETFLKNMKVE